MISIRSTPLSSPTPHPLTPNVNFFKLLLSLFLKIIDSIDRSIANREIELRREIEVPSIHLTTLPTPSMPPSPTTIPLHPLKKNVIELRGKETVKKKKNKFENEHVPNKTREQQKRTTTKTTTRITTKHRMTNREMTRFLMISVSV